MPASAPRKFQLGLCAAPLAWGWPDLGQAPAPAIAQLEFNSAGLTLGAGVEPPRGSKPSPQGVAGEVRIDYLRPQLRQTISGPLRVISLHALPPPPPSPSDLPVRPEPQ